MEALYKRRRYPSKARVRQYVELANEMGLDVAGFEVTADGAIRVFEARTAESEPISAFDRYKDQL